MIQVSKLLEPMLECVGRHGPLDLDFDELAGRTSSQPAAGADLTGDLVRAESDADEIELA
ncbi:MAG: hypothetical protein AAF690_14520 [Acidobacteriota bacterium]